MGFLHEHTAYHSRNMGQYQQDARLVEGFLQRDRFFIVCDVCDSRFGGPSAGDYSPDTPDLEEYLRAEALDLGWIEITDYGTGMMCGVACSKKWLSRKMMN